MMKDTDMMQIFQSMTPEQMQTMMAMMANMMNKAEVDPDSPEYTATRNAAIEAKTRPDTGTYYEYFNEGKIDNVTKQEQFYDDALYTTIFGTITNEILQNQLQNQLEQRAKNIGGTSLVQMFRKNCTAKKKQIKKENEIKAAADAQAMRDREAAELEEKRRIGHKTEFKNMPEWCTGNKYIGEDWICNDEEGIYRLEECGKTVKRVEACGRAITINYLLDPIDGGDGIDRVEIAYDSERGWQHRVVTRDMLVNQAEAIKLAKFSVDITSDMARPFTNCMASMLRESSKRNAIPSIPSSRKLAIMKDKEIILPFRSKDFVFEREADFPGLLAAVTPNETDAGYSETEYMNAYRAMRKRNLPGFNLMTAAILSSPVVCMTNANGWVFNMHGPTGCGKSFLLSMGTTLFGDYYHENGTGYVKTPLMTNTAAETMCDTLHCYPLIIDDYNLLTEQKDRDKFNKNIMLFSNGLGKERATKTLALVKPGFWKLTTIIAAEQSIREAAKQGGVSNRLFEITLDDQCPLSKEEIDKILIPFNNTHGFAGIKFIEALNKMGVDAIREMVTGYAKKITEKMKEKGLDKTNKQIDIAAILLATDEIAKNELFHDDVQLDVDEVIKWMADNDEVKQESRFYNTIIDKIYANPRKIEGLGATSDNVGEFWGVYDSELIEREIVNKDGKIETKSEPVKTISFIPSELEKIAISEGASVGAFKDYLKRKNLLIHDEGRMTTRMKIPSSILGKRVRVIKFILPDDDNETEAKKEDKKNSTIPFQQAAADVRDRRRQQAEELAEDIPFAPIG